MHYLSSFVLLSLSLPLMVRCKTIYIDSTCTEREDWDNYWKETQSYAKRALQRMASASDTDFRNVFKIIFKTEKDSEGEKFVKGILEQIEQLKPKYGSAPVTLPVPGVDLTPIADVTPTDDLKSSDIRLYCDNDKRWKKSETSGHWLDPINDMVFMEEPSCREDQVAGRNYWKKAKPSDPPAGHNENRVVVTICDESFKKVKSEDPPPLWISEEYKKVDLEKTLVDYLSRLVSHTLLHELVHAVSAKDEELAVQDLPDLDKAYGWDNIYAQDAGIATKNADNYAFLGLWAILGDMGYTLPRLNQKGVPEDEEEVRKENEEEGVMYKLADITKRTLAASVAVTFSA